MEAIPLEVNFHNCTFFSFTDDTMIITIENPLINFAFRLVFLPVLRNTIVLLIHYALALLISLCPTFINQVIN